jgi:hypothetical protein
MIIKLKYLVQDVDRHGSVRSYVRVKSPSGNFIKDCIAFVT